MPTKTKCNRCGRAIEVKLITRCDWCDGKVVTAADIDKWAADGGLFDSIMELAEEMGVPTKTWPPTLERK